MAQIHLDQFTADQLSGFQVLKLQGQMNAADIEALNSASLNFATIDLQDAYLNASKDAFTISNPNVKSLILPDYWDKATVKAAVLLFRTPLISSLP